MFRFNRLSVSAGHGRSSGGSSASSPASRSIRASSWRRSSSRSRSRDVSAKTFYLETHGCQMNEHDSERMAGLMEVAGYRRVADRR